MLLNQSNSQASGPTHCLLSASRVSLNCPVTVQLSRVSGYSVLGWGLTLQLEKTSWGFPTTLDYDSDLGTRSGTSDIITAPMGGQSDGT